MWFILDGLGIALGVLTWALLAFADWVVVRHVFVAWFWSSRPRISWLPFTDVGSLLFVVYQTVIALAWYSHFTSATTDPGTIPQTLAPSDLDNPRFCRLCQVGDDDDANGDKKQWKPPRAHHCKTCRRCIFRMDHHCPWVNNCVGITNQKLFILFLCYTALSAIMTLLLLATSAAFWLWSQKSWMDAAPPSCTALICSGIVAVECLAAVLFVGDFLQEQIESIQMNSTLVETYQRTHGKRTNFGEHFRGIFGRCWWKWPLPYPTAPAPDYREPAEVDEDESMLYYGASDDNDSLGIAGEESEVIDDSFDPANASRSTLRERHSAVAPRHRTETN